MTNILHYNQKMMSSIKVTSKQQKLRAPREKGTTKLPSHFMELQIHISILVVRKVNFLYLR